MNKIINRKKLKMKNNNEIKDYLLHKSNDLYFCLHLFFISSNE